MHTNPLTYGANNEDRKSSICIDIEIKECRSILKGIRRQGSNSR